MSVRIGSLFSGYGGLDQAVTALWGGSVAWHADLDPPAAAVLAHHAPTVPNHGDITGIDWHRVEPVSVLTGGFPCQDLSSAGRRAGMAPGTRSGLWSHMAHAISCLRPETVVIENVRGLLSAPANRDVEPEPDAVGNRRTQPVLRGLGAVLGDLAQLGYDARWYGLRAADVGAPHGRFRVFLVAADTDDLRRQRDRVTRHGRAGSAHRGDSAAHPDSPGRQGREPAGRYDLPARGAVADTDGRRRRAIQPDHGPWQPDPAWGDYAAAITRWQRLLGRPAPAPTIPGRHGNPALNPAFTEWLMGLNEGHVCAVPRLSRTAQLRLLGNGVVPQQATAALRHLTNHAVALDTPEAAA